MADVVPLLGRRTPDVPEPADVFADAAESTRALSVSWSQEERVVCLSVESAGCAPVPFALDAEDVLDLVRALVDGLAEPDRGRPRRPAVVLPMAPRPRRD